jgi:hypothetical protein
MEEVHGIIDKIERDVLREMDIFLVIHIDPVEVKDKTILEKKKTVINLVRNLEPEAAIHDFRVVNGEDTEKLFFDLVVPYSYNEKDEHSLLTKLKEDVGLVYEKCKCVITIEKSYISE